MLVLVAGFVALGVWQVQRRAWKHALIAAVDARVHAAPVAAPGPDKWAAITARKDAYRRVALTGRFDHDKAVRVRAATDLGSGYWLMTPLDTGRFIVLVNRGFVPPDGQMPGRTAVAQPPGVVRVTGLLRVTEPKGGFLRRNDPAAARWYSRDVAAIAQAQGLSNVAPYFVDAETSPEAKGYPVAGLTVVRFPDNHLGYALTWFALAGLSGWGAWRVAREARGASVGEAA
ncbi:MAG: SURF1 family protein [Pseudomonadota bacterium]